MDLALCVVVAACWGATNPLLEKGARDEGECRKEDFAAAAFVGWLARWRFVAPFLLNQAGSVLNIYLVSRASSSLRNPVMVATAQTPHRPLATPAQTSWSACP